MEKRRDYERLLEGYYDLHVHSYPDMSLDNGGVAHSMDDVIEGCRQYKMGGLVLKNHGLPAPALAAYLNSKYDDFDVIGSICLNSYAGGAEPYVVEMAAEVGAEFIWLPTVTSKNEYKNPGMRTLIHNGEWLPLLDKLDESYFIDILDENGNLLPNIKEIVALCKEKDLTMATGHISHEESLAVCKFAKSIGYQKVVVTHANCCCSYNTVDQMRQFAEMGYPVEICTVEFDPYFVDMTLGLCKEIIETCGPEHVVMSSDWYMGWRKEPASDILNVLSRLHFFGVKYEDLETMMKTPGRLLGKC